MSVLCRHKVPIRALATLDMPNGLSEFFLEIRFFGTTGFDCSGIKLLCSWITVINVEEENLERVPAVMVWIFNECKKCIFIIRQACRLQLELLHFRKGAFTPALRNPHNSSPSVAVCSPVCMFSQDVDVLLWTTKLTTESKNEHDTAQKMVCVFIRKDIFISNCSNKFRKEFFVSTGPMFASAERWINFTDCCPFGLDCTVPLEFTGLVALE